MICKQHVADHDGRERRRHMGAAQPEDHRTLVVREPEDAASAPAAPFLCRSRLKRKERPVPLKVLE